MNPRTPRACQVASIIVHDHREQARSYSVFPSGSVREPAHSCHLRLRRGD
jgi:hypothetical protein